MRSPVIVMIRMPTKTLSVWKVAPATVMRKPIPAVAAYSSPTTTPRSARPEAYLSPVKMKGTVPGKTMLQKILNSDAPKLRATLRKRSSVV